MPAGAFEKLKRNERKARQAVILSAAQKLFSEKDFRQVTARQIAKVAGISPGTLYRYYKNMDDLFIDIFLDNAREITQLLDNAFKKQQGYSIDRFCEIYVGYLNKNMTFYQMMGHFMLSGDLPSEKSDKMGPIMRGLMDQLEEILKSEGANGDTRLAAHTLFSSLNGIMISYAGYPGRNTDEIRQHRIKLAGQVAKLFKNKTT